MCGEHCCQTWVYPRVCGGTAALAFLQREREGLSPRVRGNQYHPAPLHATPRSIPACAGEPRIHRAMGRRHRVYPRVCGGTLWATRRRCGGTGCGWVYPRVCGGTIHFQPIAIGVRGLSPRVRGNRQFGRTAHAFHRSIPACAGEPRLPAPVRYWVRVYPRVCGGTDRTSTTNSSPWGLSPRVRGNHLLLLQQVFVIGSIPACAGEPSAPIACMMRSTVYPRVCGGTESGMTQAKQSNGLSPRVRGNRHAAGADRGACGSIPACAGEPRALYGMHKRGRVYPRVCGGTSKRSFLVASFAKWLYLSCTSLSRCRRRRLSLWAPLREAVFAGRQPLMARARSSLSTLAAIRHTTEQGLPRPFSLCRASCSERCIRRALSPTWPRQESLDNALQH